MRPEIAHRLVAKDGVTTRTALTKAKRGAAFLDAKLGRGWRRKIRRRKLDLSSTCNCIIGQLYDDEYNLGLSDLGISFRRDEQARLGFEEGHRASYDQLTEAWLEVLREKA